MRKTAAALLVIASMCVGCGGPKKAATPPPGSASAALPEADRPPARVELGYELFFREADLLVGANLVELRKNPVIADAAMRLLERFKGPTECLFSRAQKIVWAMEQATVTSVMVVRGYTPDQAASCMKTLKLEPRRPTPTTIELTASNGQQVFIKWLDDITALGGNLPRARMEKLTAQQGRLRDNQAMVTVLEEVNRNAAVYGGLLMPPASSVTPVGTIKAAHFSLEVKKGVSLRVAVMMNTDQEASKAANLTSSSLNSLSSSNSLSELIANTRITAEGSNVLIRSKLTNDQLRTLIASVKNDPLLQMLFKRAVNP